MSTETEMRQSATLYSWDTKADDIRVKINGSYVEVRIGDTTIMLSASSGETCLDLIKKFGEVEVVNTTTSKIKVQFARLGW